MNTPASCLQPKRGLTPWEEFKFWTKAKDGYRTENYLDAFEEFGQLLVKHNKW
jgi:ABC-type transport system involved in cytochrome c biogenesis ATPase subunit